MSKPNSKALRANLTQGSSPNEQTGGAVWGPVNVAHSRKTYMGWKNPDLGYATRTDPRMSDRAAEAIALQQGQYQHALWRQRGMPGKRDYADGGSVGSLSPSGRIKASHQFGLGPLVQRAADLGHDPINKYVGARELLGLTSPGGHIHLHERSAFPTMGTDILSHFNPGTGQ